MSYNDLDYDDDDMSWKDFFKTLLIFLFLSATTFVGAALILYILFG